MALSPFGAHGDLNSIGHIWAMDDIFADNQQSPEDDLASQAWMFGLEDVGYAPPGVATTDPLAKTSWLPPTEEDFDRVVREAMVDNMTERVHLKRRIDTVHNKGEPDEKESFNVAMRALWAVPLVLLTNSIQLVSKPLSTCCSMTVRPPVDTPIPSGEPLEPVPSAEQASSQLDGGAARGGWCEPRLPTAARAFCATVRREEPLPVPASADSASAHPGQPAPDEATAASPASVVAAAEDVVEQAAAAAAPSEEPAPGQAQEVSTSETVGELPQMKKPAKKTRNDRASAISVGGGMTSGVGNLLGSYAKQGKKGGDRASAVGLSSGSASAASNLLGATAQPGSAGGRSGRSGTAATTDEVTPGSASKSESRKKKPGDGKTVVSNFQSNSATSNLLGGMMAQQNKKKASSKRADATASVIG